MQWQLRKNTGVSHKFNREQRTGSYLDEIDELVRRQAVEEAGYST
jgi:hypothetical protein